MGVSASASVIIGFEVQHEDFWVQGTETDSFLSCPSGHKKNAKEGKHCADCGGKFDYQSRDTNAPTDMFAKYVKEFAKDLDYKPEPNEVWSDDPDARFDERVDRSAFGGLDLLVADGYHDSEMGDPSLYVLGTELSGTGDILEGSGGGRARGMDETNLKRHFDQCREIANKLGIDRPVKMYLTTSCG